MGKIQAKRNRERSGKIIAKLIRGKRKLDDYDDQNLSKFIQKPLSIALKAEIRTHFLFVRV